MSMLLTTVVVVSPDGKKVLLGMKKRGFGVGRWNGFGGKVKDNESINDCAKRELYEEAGIDGKNLEEMGVINFFNADPEVLEVHFFSVSEFEGTPKETGEMKPQWFNIKDIPYDHMWPDDKYWLPMLLDEKKFKGSFWFKDKQNTHIITKYELSGVKALNWQ